MIKDGELRPNHTPCDNCGCKASFVSEEISCCDKHSTEKSASENVNIKSKVSTLTDKFKLTGN